VIQNYKEDQFSKTPFTLIEDLRGKYFVINADHIQKIHSMREYEHKDYYKYEVKINVDGFPDYDHIFNMSLLGTGISEYRFESAGNIWNEFNNITEHDPVTFPFIDWELDGDPTFINTSFIQFVEIEKAILDYGGDEWLEDMERDFRGV